MFTDLITGMGEKVREFNSANLGIKQNDVSDLTNTFQDLDPSYMKPMRYLEPLMTSPVVTQETRWEATREFLTHFNERHGFEKFITYYLSPSNLRLLECDERTKNRILNIVNKFLEVDGFRVTITTREVQIKEISDESPVQVTDFINIDDDLIKRELESCDEAIRDKQFRTAVSSAKNLLEATLGYIDRNLPGESNENVKNHDLPDLYKRVTKKLHYHQAVELEGSFKGIVKSMLTCLLGVAGIRNKVGTGHATPTSQIPIEKHHALLVVNAAKTIILFLWQIYTKQKTMSSKADQENTT